MEGMKGHPYRSIVALLVLLLLMPTVQSLVITPRESTLEEYDSSQEVVITFYNDQFEPMGCQPTTDYLSSYLGEHITIEPSKFLIEHDEQVNVRITTSFPEGMPPQRHDLTLLAYPGSEEEFTISFRPPGEQQVALLLQEFHSEEGEYGESATVTVNLKNAGNTVLFVTPQVFIKQQGSIVKNTTYKRPIIIQPNEIYPLTLRQDNSDLRPGEYTGLVQALYKADGETRITDEELFVFTVIERGEEALSSNWWMIAGIVGSVAVLASGIVWLVPAVARRQQRRKEQQKKREKHITEPSAEMREAWHEVYLLRKDLAAVSEEVQAFVEESELWLRQHQKGG